MRSALLVIDMLNRYEHADAEPLMASAACVVPKIQRLIASARDHDVLTVYVNDNYGDWSAAREELSRHAMGGAAPSLVEPILPDPALPFVVKARHSVFYETQLEYLLRQEGIERVLLTGQVTEQCILYSALDAYVRHLRVGVIVDAVAHIREELAQAALRMMEINMRAELLDAESVPLADDAA